MPKPRQQQHRPAREAQKARELADVKRENDRLSKQNARLRKQMEKVTGEPPHRVMVESVVGPQVKLEEPRLCPVDGCGTKLQRLDLGVGSFDVCPGCKFRRRAA